MENKKKEVLLVSRLSKFFSDFELSNIEILTRMGYEVWCAANFDDDTHKIDEYNVHKFHLNYQRSPLSTENLKENKKLEALIKEHDFALMHCHMPIGGVFARLAAKHTKLTPVIYTVHGMQFCKGGPKRDWLLFYPVEKYLSRYTDTLITINQEDYDLATKKFHAKNVMHIKGIGIDLEKYANVVGKRDELCEEIGIDSNDFLMLCVSELSARKNQEVLIRGFAEALSKSDDKNMQLILCGIGVKEEFLKDLCRELGIDNKVHFLGYRNDIYEITKSVDCYTFPTKREGLPVALMEAMAAGLPTICSAARGNTELVVDGENGFICEQNIPSEYEENILKMHSLWKEEKETGVNNQFSLMSKDTLEKIKEFDIHHVKPVMEKMYRNYLD